MRSVQIEASAHHSPRGSPPVASVPCLALAGTAETSACLHPDLTHPASCLPSLGPVLLPGRSAVRRGCGTMKALTPARLTQAPRSLRLHRSAFPTFRPQPRGPPDGRFSRRSAPASCSRLRHLMSRLATDPAETGSSSYGLSVHLRLLPTPPRWRRSYLRLHRLRPPMALDFHSTNKSSSRTHRRGAPGLTSLHPAGSGISPIGSKERPSLSGWTKRPLGRRDYA